MGSTTQCFIITLASLKHAGNVKYLLEYTVQQIFKFVLSKKGGRGVKRYS